MNLIRKWLIVLEGKWIEKRMSLKDYKEKENKSNENYNKIIEKLKRRGLYKEDSDKK